MARQQRERILGRMVGRLNGAELPAALPKYMELVRQGIGGFIIFGGERESLRDGISALQSIAQRPLIISSDLEQGLGQQVSGGTLLPPAMAMGRAYQKNPAMVREAMAVMASEAASMGINTIFAPVLDIDSNPLNPIIATRSFGSDAETVSDLASELTRACANHGIVACGKHFPGHGDTEVDSHIGLPSLDKTIPELEAMELLPFRHAISGGIPMLMLAHMSVRALDNSGTPVSCSGPAVRFLRDEMRFSGILTTDAMNMGALSDLGEAHATKMALDAGVEIILHPSDPLAMADAIASMELEQAAFDGGSERLERFRSALSHGGGSPRITERVDLTLELSKLALHLEGHIQMPGDAELIILTDDASTNASALISGLGLPHHTLTGPDMLPPLSGRRFVVAVFSSVRAWKGGSASWLRLCLDKLATHTALAISFGSPHLIADLHAPRLYAYWGSDAAQTAVAMRLQGK